MAERQQQPAGEPPQLPVQSERITKPLNAEDAPIIQTAEEARNRAVEILTNTDSMEFAQQLINSSRAVVATLERAQVGIAAHADAVSQNAPYSVAGSDYNAGIAERLGEETVAAIPAALTDARLNDDVDMGIVSNAHALVHAAFSEVAESSVEPLVSGPRTEIYRGEAANAVEYLTAVPDALTAIQEQEGQLVAEAVVDIILDDAHVEVPDETDYAGKSELLRGLVAPDGEIVTRVRLDDVNAQVMSDVEEADRSATEFARTRDQAIRSISSYMALAGSTASLEATFVRHLNEQQRIVAARQASIGGDPVAASDLQWEREGTQEGVIARDANVDRANFQLGSDAMQATQRVFSGQADTLRTDTSHYDADDASESAKTKARIRQALEGTAGLIESFAAAGDKDPRALATFLEVAQRYDIHGDSTAEEADAGTIASETLRALASAVRAAGAEIDFTDPRTARVVDVAREIVINNATFTTPVTADDVRTVASNPANREDAWLVGRFGILRNRRRVARADAAPVEINGVQISVAAGTRLDRAALALADEAVQAQLGTQFETQGQATGIEVSGKGTRRRPLRVTETFANADTNPVTIAVPAKPKSTRAETTPVAAEQASEAPQE